MATGRTAKMGVMALMCAMLATLGSTTWAMEQLSDEELAGIVATWTLGSCANPEECNTWDCPEDFDPEWPLTCTMFTERRYNDTKWERDTGNRPITRVSGYLCERCDCMLYWKDLGPWQCIPKEDTCEDDESSYFDDGCAYLAK